MWVHTWARLNPTQFAQQESPPGEPHLCDSVHRKHWEQAKLRDRRHVSGRPARKGVPASGSDLPAQPFVLGAGEVLGNQVVAAAAHLGKQTNHR